MHEKMDTQTITDVSLRTVTSEVNLLSQPDGSASFNHGDTSALVAVYGPAEVKLNRELIDRATIDVIYKPKVGLPGCAEKHVEYTLRSVCESMLITTLHPRSLLSVVIQEVQDSGSFLACCVNATCLALLDACYPMRFTVAAVACSYTSDGQFVLDPVVKQEHNATSHMTFVFDSLKHDVVTCYSTGVFTPEQYKRAVDACRKASKVIFQFYRDSVKKKLLKLLP